MTTQLARGAVAQGRKRAPAGLKPPFLTAAFLNNFCTVLAFKTVEVKIWFRWNTPTSNCINHCLPLNISLWFFVNLCSSWYPRKKGRYPCSPHSLPSPRLDCHHNLSHAPRALDLNLFRWHAYTASSMEMPSNSLIMQLLWNYLPLHQHRQQKEYTT